MSDRNTEENSCKLCIMGLAEYTIDLWCCAGCLMDFGVHVLQLRIRSHESDVVVQNLRLVYIDRWLGLIDAVLKRSLMMVNR